MSSDSVAFGAQTNQESSDLTSASPRDANSDICRKAFTTNLLHLRENTKDGGAMAETQWYAAVVNHNNERKAAASLEQLGYATFVPMQHRYYRTARKRVKREVVVINAVVFVSLPPAAAITLDRQPYIYKVMRTPGSSRPTPISEKELDAFKFMLETYDDQLSFVAERVNLGDEVLVVRGKLKGMTGRISRAGDKQCTFSVSIGFVGAAQVTIPLSCVKVLKPAPAH